MSSLLVENLFSVKGMVFVITGGGSGLGSMMAESFAANGAAKVFILGRRLQSLKNVAQKDASGRIIPIECDVSSKESLEAASNAIKSQTPYINTLIGNSGVIGPVTHTGGPRPDGTTLEAMRAQLWDTSLEEHEKALKINLIGQFYTFLAFVDLLEAGNKHPDSIGSQGYSPSQFITTTSLGGLSRAENVSHLYSSGKAGLVHLTKMISTTFAPHGIRANSIAPGLFITEMTDFVADGADLTVPGSLPRQAIPSTRTGAAEDIAGAAIFLASRAGGFVNGSILVVDGGALSITPGTY